jgi:hypothetical protein
VTIVDDIVSPYWPVPGISRRDALSMLIPSDMPTAPKASDIEGTPTLGMPPSWRPRRDGILPLRTSFGSVEAIYKDQVRPFGDPSHMTGHGGSWASSATIPISTVSVINNLPAAIDRVQASIDGAHAAGTPAGQIRPGGNAALVLSSVPVNGSVMHVEVFGKRDGVLEAPFAIIYDVDVGRAGVTAASSAHPGAITAPVKLPVKLVQTSDPKFTAVAYAHQIENGTFQVTTLVQATGGRA